MRTKYNSQFILRYFFVLGVLFCACNEPKTIIVNEGPVAYGANGLAAPAVFTIAPKPPRSMGYPAMSVAEMPVNEPPVLPSLDNRFGENAAYPMRGLREPLMVGLNPDLADNRPLMVNGLDPRQPLPVEQKIYEGAYSTFDHDAPYFHHDGDEIIITVKDNPEFSGKSNIERDGRCKIPGTDDYIVARDRDAQQITQSVAQTLRPYLRKFPSVRVVTDSASGGYYYVLGGVLNQGRFPLGAQSLRLSDAVFRANSTLLGETRTVNNEANAKAREHFTLEQNAALERVMVITPHRTAPQATVYNVAQAIYGGVNAQNPIIKPNQIIVVGENNNLRLEEYIREALARDNKRAPLLKTYGHETAPPYLNSPALNTYANSRNPVE